MNKLEKLNLIHETGIIVILRADSSKQLMAVADAVRDGGVRAIEVTMNTPDALDLIKEAGRRYGSELLFGAGTVLDAETALAAILAGADFIVSPVMNPDVISLCSRYGIPAAPGCLTPTEMFKASEAGADLIKLFPANIGGPGLIKSLLAPLSQLNIIPTGGVNQSNAAEFIRQGAFAVGVGSSLTGGKKQDNYDMKEITRRSEELINEVKKGRK